MREHHATEADRNDELPDAKEVFDQRPLLATREPAMKPTYSTSMLGDNGVVPHPGIARER
jgi:hypothetical protein